MGGETYNKKGRKEEVDKTKGNEESGCSERRRRLREMGEECMGEGAGGEVPTTQ